MKYKVGDKVKVHTLEYFEKHCDKEVFDFGIITSRYLFTKDMYKYCNKYATIISIDNENECYKIKEDNGKYYWCDWMFEDLNNNINTIYNPNIVEDFAKLIGIELDAEFYDNEDSLRYKFTADSGLMLYDDAIEDWRVAAFSLTTVFKMIKEGKFMKKWTPKDGDAVYFPSFCCNNLWSYITYDSEKEHDKEMLKNGLYFKTKEEAVECAKKIIKNMKEG